MQTQLFFAVLRGEQHSRWKIFWTLFWFHGRYREILFFKLFPLWIRTNGMWKLGTPRNGSFHVVYVSVCVSCHSSANRWTRALHHRDMDSSAEQKVQVRCSPNWRHQKASLKRQHAFPETSHLSELSPWLLPQHVSFTLKVCHELLICMKVCVCVCAKESVHRPNHRRI